jgi:amino-acid N-acetyltransferase
VKRAHLVDARLDGGMLLELYSRDGVGTMISTDFYEGIRRATGRDLEAIAVGAWRCGPLFCLTATCIQSC